MVPCHGFAPNSDFEKILLVLSKQESTSNEMLTGMQANWAAADILSAAMQDATSSATDDVVCSAVLMWRYEHVDACFDCRLLPSHRGISGVALCR
eukprot:s2187_g3.t1